MIIASSCSIDVDELLHSLSQAFPVKDLGQLSYFLGVELTHLSNGVLFNQRKCILDIFKKKGHDQCQSCFLTNGNFNPSSLNLTYFDNPTFFRSIVGSLQYLSLTRSDIFFSVNKVCQFIHNPTISHWGAVKRIIQYLKSTIKHGIFFSRKSTFQLHAYFDTNWAGCPNDCRSTGDYYIFLDTHLIS